MNNNPIYIIKSSRLLLFLFLCCISSSFAQLQVNTSKSPTQLVEEILLGPGINANNVKFSGDKTISISEFDYNEVVGSNNLGLERGLFLSTGKVQNAIGVNTVSNTGSQGSNLSDKDLDTVIKKSGKKTTDAVVIEFDFVPMSDSIEFKYVFASEEYPEFNCSSYNDVFGFFLTGTNPASSSNPYTNYNLALVPNTLNTTVSVNTINSGVANDPTICDNIDPNWKTFSQFFVSNLPGTPGANQLTFDGYTKPLIAKASVKCGETYHLKIAIADVGDQNYDSGVFLLANSLFSNIISAETKQETNDLSIIVDSVIVENCTKGLLTFKLAKKSTQATNINYTVKGTATNGVDFNTLSGVAIIPANQDSIQQIIVPITDALSEGDETITIEYNAGGCAGTVSKSFILKDAPVPPITSFSYNDTICMNSLDQSIIRGEGFEKGGVFSSSSPDIAVNSNTGKITIANSKPGTYTVTYTIPTINACTVGGHTDVQVTINPLTDPTTSFSYQTPLCQNPGTASPILVPNFVKGGVFSSTSGLSINANSGAVNLETSTPGIYKVLYTYSKSECYNAKKDSTTVEIIANPTPLPGFSYASPVCVTDVNPTPTPSPGFVAGGEYKCDDANLVFASKITGEVDLSKTPIGTYAISYSVLNPNGCTASTLKYTLSIIANTTPKVTFTYDTPLCTGSGKKTPKLATNFSTGGVFSCSDNALKLDAITGEINLNTSTKGSYAIKYSFPVTSCNAAIDTTVNIVIDDLITQNTDFTYPSPICITSTNPLPTGTFVIGGDFTSTDGLTIATKSGKVSLLSSVAGTYEITYTLEGSGCYAKSVGKFTLVIEPSSAPITNFSYERPICVNSPDPLPILPNGFTTGGVFSTTSAIGVDPVTGQLTMADTKAGSSYTIVYKISSSACGGTGESETEVLIVGLSKPTTEFNYSTTEFCVNSTNQLPTLDPLFESGGEFSTNAGLGVDKTNGELNFSNTPIGTYTITYKVLEKLCIAEGETTKTIELSDLPIVTIGMNNPICIGDTLKLSTNQYPGATYRWTGPNNFVDSIYNPQINNLVVANNGDYSVETTLKGCKSSETSLVVIKDVEILHIDPIGPFCKNDTNNYVLKTNKAGGRWIGSGLNLNLADSSLASYQPNKTILDTITLIYLTKEECGGRGELEIINNALPINDFKVDKTRGCTPLLVKLNPNNNIAVDSTIWFLDGERIILNDDSTYVLSETKCYTLTAISYSQGCFSNNNKDSAICVLSQPHADFHVKDTLISIFDTDQSYDNLSTNATGYTWYFGDGTNSKDINPTHTFPKEPGVYYTRLYASQEDLCFDETYIKIRIPEEILIYIPNTFSPNGDKLNEAFNPIISDVVNPSSYTFSIFNRWGELLFESHDKSIGWLGKYGDAICIDGTYVWKLEFIDTLKNEKHSFKGHVNLLK
jgi:gliding motility-associated-like protein